MDSQFDPQSETFKFGYDLKINPLPEYKPLFDSYASAMKYVSRPVCTLREYIETYHGRPMADLLADGTVRGEYRSFYSVTRDKNKSEGAVFWGRIYKLIPGPGMDPGVNVSNMGPGPDYAAAAGNTLEVVDRTAGMAETRKDWDLILEEYRKIIRSEEGQSCPAGMSMETRQEKDLELWQEWKKTRNPATLSKLLDRLHPLIVRETGKWQSSVPQVALEAKARILTVEALESYNPNMGAAIGTHITSRLRKLSRSVYPYQNVARLPENKQLLYNTFQVAQNRLLDAHGREPTTEEIADELRWTPKKVADFQRSFGRRELVESEGAFIEDDQQDSNSGGLLLSWPVPGRQTALRTHRGVWG